MAETRQLKPPPPQSVPGVVLYHPDTKLDHRIRQVASLVEAGYDLDTICQSVERRPTQVKAYMRQIRRARLAYMEAYPEEFASGVEGLRAAILERRDFDALLRRELYSQTTKNPSNRVGLLKIIMRNMRELEELVGLLVQRFEHSGSVGIKDELQNMLDSAPEPEREAYLDALTALIGTTEAQPTHQTDSE